MTHELKLVSRLSYLSMILGVHMLLQSPQNNDQHIWEWGQGNPQVVHRLKVVGREAPKAGFLSQSFLKHLLCARPWAKGSGAVDGAGAVLTPLGSHSKGKHLNSSFHSSLLNHDCGKDIWRLVEHGGQGPLLWGVCEVASLSKSHLYTALDPGYGYYLEQESESLTFLLPHLHYPCAHISNT